MIGDKDDKGNALRLGGKEVSVWERPNGTLELRFTNREEVYVAKTEQEAIDWYNKIEDSNHFKLPDLSPSRPDSQEAEEPLLLPDGAKLLGKFESESTLGLFYYVIQYKDAIIRCTCWPFIRNRTCSHREFVQKVLTEISIEKLIEKPIVAKYNREEL